MGVKGLWQLLLPTGRRISIETLTGKTLAIDASIWLTQFIKAHRDPETGKVHPAAHIIGFYRRICKLLFHGIKPVFVFDGATPEIKLNELRKRRERREKIHSFGSSDDKEGVKRLAKRLLVAQLKKQKEMELGFRKNVKNDCISQTKANNKSSNIDGAFAAGFNPGGSESNHSNIDQIISETKEYIDTNIIESKRDSEENDWDNVLTNTWAQSDDDNCSQSSIEIPENENHLNSHILSSLPTKTRIDVIEKTKRQQRMQSRKEFMSVAGNPDSYSQCQLRNFLKSANFTKKINDVAKIVSSQGRNGGEFGSEEEEGEKIASDSTRRFIFKRYTDNEEEIRQNDTFVANNSSQDGHNIEIKTSSNKRRRLTKVSRLGKEDSDEDTDDDEFLVESDQSNAKNTVAKDCARIGAEFQRDDNSLSNSDDEGEGGFIKSTDAHVHESALSCKSNDHENLYATNKLVLEVDDDSDHGNNDSEKSIQSNTCLICDDGSDDEEGGFIKSEERHDLTLSTEAHHESILLNNDFIEQNDNVTNEIISHADGGFVESKKQAKRDIVNIQSDTEEKHTEPSPSNDMAIDIRVDGDNDGVDVICGGSDEDSNVDIEWEDCEAFTDVHHCESNELKSRPSMKTKDQGQEEHSDNANGDDSNNENMSSDLNEILKPTTEKESDLNDYGRIPNGLRLENVHDTFELPFNEVCDVKNSDDEIELEDSVKVNQNTLALKMAQSTASNLADWAGRAFQRAIKDIDPSKETESNTEDSADSAIEESSFSNYPSSMNLTRQPSSSEFLGFDTSLSSLREQEMNMQEDMYKRERDIDAVTEDMIEDIIQLLQLFGIPYVQAPGEAEAQCAALEKLRLVDGVCTEDSDALVFGSNCVYKNIFDDKKYVEVYRSKDAEKLGLGYNEKIALAMLLGGDYTDGVRGVGIVNGMEIIQAFPVNHGVREGLGAFRKWMDGDGYSDVFLESLPGSDTFTSQVQYFDTKHKAARLRWVMPKDFPSNKVFQAYSHPVVDNSNQKFTFGSPDVEKIKVYCRRRMGWDEFEIDRSLKPVMEKIDSASTQTTLDDYIMRYEDNLIVSHQIKSRRLQEVFKSVHET